MVNIASKPKRTWISCSSLTSQGEFKSFWVGPSSQSPWAWGYLVRRYREGTGLVYGPYKSYKEPQFGSDFGSGLDFRVPFHGLWPLPSLNRSEVLAMHWRLGARTEESRDPCFRNSKGSRPGKAPKSHWLLPLLHSPVETYVQTYMCTYVYLSSPFSVRPRVPRRILENFRAGRLSHPIAPRRRWLQRRGRCGKGSLSRLLSNSYPQYYQRQ